MEAVLLMLDVFAAAQVLVWAARGRGFTGLLAWRDDRQRSGTDGGQQTRG